MPIYVEKALRQFQLIKKKEQHTPHEYTKHFYGKKIQYSSPPDKSRQLNLKGSKRVQSVCGNFVYYARAVDPTILPAIHEITMVQSNPTESTNNKIKMLIDYYPNAKIRYHASDMALHVDSDAAYLVLPKARSRIAGYFYLSKACTITITITKSPAINGSILVEYKVLRHVVSSATEAETGGLFHNYQTAIMIRNILNALGHKQKLTPVKTDNSTDSLFVNDLLKQNSSK